jgi:hypothetical protein
MDSGMLRFVAERGNERFEIIEGDWAEGFYILRYVGAVNTHDYLGPTIAGVQGTAEHEWGVAPSAWRNSLPDELPVLWQQPRLESGSEGGVQN